MTNYTAVRFAKRPTGLITPDVFEVVTLQIPELEDGQVLLKQSHMHLAPSMRGLMDASQTVYAEPLAIGEIMRSVGIAEVAESRNDQYPVGTRVFGPTGWSEYVVSDGAGLTPLPEQLSAEAVLCVISPGLTAYYGLLKLAQATAGETLVVSGGAGAVGSLVGQIGKATGMRVIGLAGNQEKCAWMEQELGFDRALNYKSSSLLAELEAATPDGIDVYFENTGGPAQAAAYARMNMHGRIIVCGMISEYNATELSPGPNWLDINRKRLTVRGFVISDHMEHAREITQKLTELLVTGKLKYRAHTLRGIESAIQGINLLFTGENRGKLLVEL